jgi:hypothetical protein
MQRVAAVTFFWRPLADAALLAAPFSCPLRKAVGRDRRCRAHRPVDARERQRTGSQPRRRGVRRSASWLLSFSPVLTELAMLNGPNQKIGLGPDGMADGRVLFNGQEMWAECLTGSRGT